MSAEKQPGAATEIKFDPSRNLIGIHYRGEIVRADTAGYLQEAQRLLPQLKPGFKLLADLSELKSMDLASVPDIRKIMDLFNQAGIGIVVRVIPDPSRDIGMQIMSLFHYGHDVQIVTCATLEEAMRAIE